jgi:hypothetical protein
MTTDPTPTAPDRNHADGSPRRLAECARNNPSNDEFYDGCCRFPKSCSPYPYPETPVTEADLEPRRTAQHRPMPTAPARPGSPDWNAWATLANHVTDALREVRDAHLRFSQRTAVAAALWAQGYRPTAGQIAAEVARQTARRDA